MGRRLDRPPGGKFRVTLVSMRTLLTLLSLLTFATSAHAEGAWVRIRGPLGLSRCAHTRIEETEPPRLLRGHAEVGRGTVGVIRWTVEPRGSGSRVAVEAEVVRASLVDRVALALGGRHWLARGLREAVEQLAEQA